MQYTTITPRFQLQIPVAVRKKIGLTFHGRAAIHAERRGDRRRIIVEPIDPKNSILSSAGIFRVKNPIPAEKIRDYIDYSWGKR